MNSTNPQFRVRNRLQIDGRLVGTVTVLAQDVNENYILVAGTTVPSAVAGYAKGCLFIKSNAGAGAKAVYENVGTTASCDFNLMGEVTGAEIGAGAITTPKLALVTKMVTVGAGTDTVVHTADATIIGGTIIGFHPLAQDQIIESINLNVSGEILISLKANATADNIFNVHVLKAS